MSARAAAMRRLRAQWIRYATPVIVMLLLSLSQHAGGADRPAAPEV